MMASLSSLEELPDSSQYANWKELRHALDSWAVCDKFMYRTPAKVPCKARYTCADADCRWTCNASKQADGMIELWVTRCEHTCWTGGVAKFSSSTSKDWLDKAVSQHLLITKTTRPKEIVETIKIHFAETISYKVAQVCQQQLLDGGLGKQHYSFQLLPAYRDTVELRCPGSTVDLQIDQRTGKCLQIVYCYANFSLITGNFQQIFVCPPHSRMTFQQCRRIVAADGTFLTGRFVLTLLLA